MPKCNFTDVVIRKNQLHHIGGAGLVPMRCENLLVEDNVFSHTGASADPRQFGMGSGMYAWRSTEVLIQRNRFEHARGWYDSAGAHIDLGNSNLVYQYNVSYDNAGGFIYVFGDCRNAAFRHNVSINDGCRVKGTPNPHNNTPNDAARTILLSDFNGQDREPTGSHHIEIHNNTIYVGPGIKPIIQIGPKSHDNLVRNNIFYVDGQITCHAQGDAAFDDNLYWGPGQRISGLPVGPMALFVDSELVNPGDVDPDGYKLTVDSPAINAGAEIASPGTFDFWGDELSQARPLDIGADEYAVEIKDERIAQIATATAERRKQRASQPAASNRKPRNPQPTGDDAQFNAWVAPFLQQLNLTDEQRPKFLALQKQMTQKWAEFQRMDPQERHAKQGAYYQARHAEMAKLLTKEQMAKYLVIRAPRAGRTSPRKPESTQGKTDAPLPSTPPDYSGKDLLGIESIAEEAEGGGERWRQQADRRIDELRKADLEIRVVDASGNPLSGVPVHVKQRRHLFHFGGVVGGHSMHEPASGQKPRRISPERYKEMYLELGFNTAGFNKYLKYKQRPRSEPHLPALFAWFQEHNIPVRGHCLMWPGGVFMNFMPPDLSKLAYVPDPSIDWRSLKKGVPRKDLTPSEKQAVRDLCKKMIEEASRQWPVFEWDVINETRDNHVVQDLVGKDVIVDWFRVARQNTMDRDAGLYLNEYRIISDPSPEVITPNMRQYEEEIRYLLDHEAPISGIGFQSRFHAETPPETIYKRLCYFEQFDLPYAATEFEMNDTVGNEFERAAMTERAMTVLFSHRLVNGIYAWSLLAQDQGGPGHRAILEDDGWLKLRGKVWMYLMKNRWWTDESLTSDANGTVRLRGFKGRYQVTVGKNPVGKSIQLRLVDDHQAELILPSG